jgi:circadian clock protein KaiC
MATGVPCCDEVLAGGRRRGRSYLLTGSASAGKTIFSLQFLLEGRKREERCMYITLAAPGAEIARNVAAFGWSLDGIEVVDLAPTGADLDEEGGEYHVFPASEVESVPAWSAISRAVEQQRPARVVIDSVTRLRFLATDEYQFRKHILALVNFLNRTGCTSLLTYEPSELEREHCVALAVDGVLRLRNEISAGLAVGLRSFAVDKLRASDYMSGLHPLRISRHGIAVFPHRIEAASSTAPTARRLASGIAGLDGLLRGGLEQGTTSLLSVPTGTGKSTLGLRFLGHNAPARRSALFSSRSPASSSPLAPAPPACPWIPSWRAAPCVSSGSTRWSSIPTSSWGSCVAPWRTTGSR